MASSQTPHNQLQNPENQTPKNPLQILAEARKNEKKSANMEKLKETVMKLLKIEPNTHLSEESHDKSHLVEERLSQFLSLLHSPDHPPYAWMIERALQELNEKGGSSEESISQFIKKEYSDLPWAHYTMLKHHLVQLCESGEVVLTCDKRYLLAGSDAYLKERRKNKRRSKRPKKFRRKENVVQKGDDVELPFGQPKDEVTSNEANMEENCTVEGIKEQKPEGDDNKLVSSHSKDLVTSREAVEEEEHMVEGVEQQKQNCDDVKLLLFQPTNQETANELHEEGTMTQGIEKRKLGAEFSKDGEKLCPAEQKGVDCCNSDAPPIVAPSLLNTDNSEKFSVQQQSSEPTEGITDIFSWNAHLEQGLKRLEDYQPEVSSPERPPGFESVTLEEVSHVQPQTIVFSKLPIHSGHLNQHDEHDILDDGKASGTELCVIKESIPTDRMQRQKKRWSKRLSGDKASLISDILPSPELQDECPAKSDLSDQDRAHGEYHTPMESILITEVQGKQCSQLQKVSLASSETPQQLDSAEPKHHVEPSEHERKKQVAQGTQTRRVLRPRLLKSELQLPSAITQDDFSSHDQQEMKKPESQCPGTEVTNKMIISVHQNKQDLHSAECEPSKGATLEKCLPKVQQIGLRRLGRPPKSRNPAKAKPDTLVVADITPSNNQNQQHNEHPPWSTTKELDATAEDIPHSKSVQDPHLEQQVEKPRHGGRGRPPKHKRGASFIEESNLQHKTTKYRGRGRPRKTDQKY
ncbi:hypothetical protein ACH5RR_029992 [Cinchona calisaya]|uniref:H15 domain-containing protein n=1 Tax=Cinchona calisaya TaxID=153742 RepID=A0ABD2YT93_9GENT